LSIEPLHNEQALFLQIAEGDEAAFRRLVDSYVPILRSMIYKLVRTEHVADDLIQETFLRVWLNRDQLPGIHNPRSWVLRIAYFLSIDFLRTQIIRQKATGRIADAQASHPIRSETEEQVVFNATLRLVGEAVRQLPAQQKKVYRLSREEGMNMEQIAETMQIAPGTVKNTLVRALRSIREYLKKAGYTGFLWIGVLIRELF
jgi:RNA polymerase sigma-70 factor (family 1)